jgi:hypothetical protein
MCSSKSSRQSGKLRLQLTFSSPIHMWQFRFSFLVRLYLEIRAREYVFTQCVYLFTFAPLTNFFFDMKNQKYKKCDTFHFFMPKGSCTRTWRTDRQTDTRHQTPDTTHTLHTDRRDRGLGYPPPRLSPKALVILFSGMDTIRPKKIEVSRLFQGKLPHKWRFLRARKPCRVAYMFEGSVWFGMWVSLYKNHSSRRK